jgi:hypothetical protein
MIEIQSKFVPMVAVLLVLVSLVSQPSIISYFIIVRSTVEVAFFLILLVIIPPIVDPWFRGQL